MNYYLCSIQVKFLAMNILKRGFFKRIIPQGCKFTLLKKKRRRRRFATETRPAISSSRYCMSLIPCICGKFPNQWSLARRREPCHVPARVVHLHHPAPVTLPFRPLVRRRKPLCVCPTLITYDIAVRYGLSPCICNRHFRFISAYAIVINSFEDCHIIKSMWLCHVETTSIDTITFYNHPGSVSGAKTFRDTIYV